MLVDHVMLTTDYLKTDNHHATRVANNSKTVQHIIFDGKFLMNLMIHYSNSSNVKWQLKSINIYKLVKIFPSNIYAIDDLAVIDLSSSTSGAIHSNVINNN